MRDWGVEKPRSPSIPIVPDDSILLGVILAPDQAVDYEGGELRLVLLELFETGFALSWHLGPMASVHTDEADAKGFHNLRFPPPRFRLVGDGDTEYPMVGGGSSAGRHYMHGRYLFQSDAAFPGSRLTAILGTHQFVFDMRELSLYQAKLEAP